MIGKGVPLGGMKESLRKGHWNQGLPKVKDPARASAGHRTFWRETAASGKASRQQWGGGRYLRTENWGQRGGNTVSKGEDGRSQVRWGPGGQHERLLWVTTARRSPWATPERGAEAVEETVCKVLSPDSPQDTTLSQHLSP